MSNLLYILRTFERYQMLKAKIVPGLLAFLFVCFGAINHAFGQNPVIFSAPDTLEGAPGDTIAVDINLNVGGNQVSFLGAAFKATNGLLSFIDFTIGPITPAAGFSLTTPTKDSIRMVYFDAGSGPITQNGVLVTFRFAIDEQANEGDIADLIFSNISASDPLSNSLPVQSVPGKFMAPFSPAHVMGIKWNDINGDGIHDVQEPGLPGWQIYLINADSTDTLATVTDAAGNYTFDSIEHGEYTIIETHRPAWVQTFPGDPPFYKITLKPGDLADTLDFGNWTPGSIHGEKWRDLNADGISDEDEPALAGWEIWLMANGDTMKATTDVNGQYWFRNLPPGEYAISERMQDGWFQSFPADTSYHFSLTQGEIFENADFGNWQPGEIHGMKWQDSDSSGARDTGELGLAGWEIWLKGTVANSVEVTDTTTTDSLGRYRFTGLTPGIYTIGEIEQSGFKQTYPKNARHDTVLVSGMQIADLDFGNKALTSTSVEDAGAGELPTVYALFQNYPNPFNPTTKIKFSVPNQSHLLVEIFDILGKRIEVLLDEEKQAGFYEIDFNAKGLSSGVYFYKLSAGLNFVALKKMIVVK